MRNIINISMPANMKKDVDFDVKDGGYASTSEFFRGIYREWKRDRLLASIRESQKEMREGKAKRFTSFREMR